MRSIDRIEIVKYSNDRYIYHYNEREITNDFNEIEYEYDTIEIIAKSEKEALEKGRFEVSKIQLDKDRDAFLMELAELYNTPSANKFKESKVKYDECK